MTEFTPNLRTDISKVEPVVVNLRCPFCRHEGAFGPVLPGHTDVRWKQPVIGQEKVVESCFAGIRSCPNRECRAVIFVIIRHNRLWAAFPPEVIDFDPTGIPEQIQSTLEEAIKCHANGCYKATALMVRRALEELCHDRKAAGNDLKSRLGALRSKIVIPDELLQAADELRILGNDAAHVEARDYDEIGEREAAVAVELAKELLKAVYQYKGLVERLRGLKGPAP